MTTSQRGQGAISNILAVAGFIILIAIVVWGAFHFFNIASSGFSSLFSWGSNDEIEVTLSNNTVSSGQPLDVSWDYTPDGAGSYALLYQCRDGFQFRSINTAGVVNLLPCGNAYAIGNESLESIRLIPALSGTSPVDVTLTVLFTFSSDTGTSTDAVRPQGSATVTVNPQTVQPPQTNGTPVGSTLPSTGATKEPTPTQSGKPDLVVRMIAVGVIDQYSGQFVNRIPTSQYDMVAVKFDIANQGSGPSGAYYFSAQLPTAPASPYTSPQQASLAAGAHIENTLRFNNVSSGGALFSVTVDQSNVVSETNEGNNTTSQWVSGIGYYQY